MNTVAEVLHKLLVVGITDTGEWEEGGHYICRSLKLGERFTPQTVHASPKFNAYIGAPLMSSHGSHFKRYSYMYINADPAGDKETF